MESPSLDAQLSPDHKKLTIIITSDDELTAKDILLCLHKLTQNAKKILLKKAIRSISGWRN